MSSRSRGFSLIELMVTITILALLVVLGTPMYTSWIANTRIRNATESIQNGLRLARAEAVQRGAPARFEITSTGADWTVCVPNPATPSTCAAPTQVVQTQVANDGASNVLIGGTTDSLVPPTVDNSVNSVPGEGVTFSALGRSLAGTTPLVKIDASSTVSDIRRLVALISPGGSVRMCDPALSQATSPQGC